MGDKWYGDVVGQVELHGLIAIKIQFIAGTSAYSFFFWGGGRGGEGINKCWGGIVRICYLIIKIKSAQKSNKIRMS